MLLLQVLLRADETYADGDGKRVWDCKKQEGKRAELGSRLEVRAREQAKTELVSRMRGVEVGSRWDSKLLESPQTGQTSRAQSIRRLPIE